MIHAGKGNKEGLKRGGMMEQRESKTEKQLDVTALRRLHLGEITSKKKI